VLEGPDEHVGVVLYIPGWIRDSDRRNIRAGKALENCTDGDIFLNENHNNYGDVEELGLLQVVADEIQRKRQKYAQLHVDSVEPSPGEAGISLSD
jgi:hypothetical protein